MSRASTQQLVEAIAPSLSVATTEVVGESLVLLDRPVKLYGLIFSSGVQIKSVHIRDGTTRKITIMSPADGGDLHAFMAWAPAYINFDTNIGLEHSGNVGVGNKITIFYTDR
jgi:hypothetical protein